MLDSIHLYNFQAHKESVLEFHPGVNVIIGSSNQGKSSILRGLYWAVYNRPSGSEFVSHWNRGKRALPEKRTAVQVYKKDKYISRVRLKEFNGYYLDTDTILEAIGTDVPEQVSQFFNFSEVNISRQMDAPFLLSESSGEVARFFNRIIRLDLIDRVLSTAESKRRTIKKDMEQAEALDKQLTEQIKAYDWTEQAEKLLKKCDNVQNRLTGKQEKKTSLSDIITDYSITESIITYLDWIPNAENKYQTVTEFHKSLISKQEQAGDLQELITDFRTCREIIKSIPEMGHAEKLIAEAERLKEQIEGKQEAAEDLYDLVSDYGKNSTLIKSLPDAAMAESKIDTIFNLWKQIKVKYDSVIQLQAWIAEYGVEQETIDRLEKQLTELTDQLPDTCPYCGAEIRKEDLC